MGTAAGLVAKALSYVGLGETPAGSNHNEITDKYANLFGEIYRYTAWCGEAVVIWAQESGNWDSIFQTPGAWTPTFARAFANHGSWHWGSAGMKQGYVVFFDWDVTGGRSFDGIDHVAVVKQVGEAFFDTIEGNSSHNDVRVTRRSYANVVGYGRPAFEGAPPDGGGGHTGEILALPQLSLGSRGMAVDRLQDGLDDTIGAGLVVDGIFGPKTRNAVTAFQSRYGLGVDGIVGPKTWAGLVQALLLRHGFDPRGVDGQYGPSSTEAVEAFQRAHSLVVDGIVGPATWAALLF